MAHLGRQAHRRPHAQRRGPRSHARVTNTPPLHPALQRQPSPPSLSLIVGQADGLVGLEKSFPSGDGFGESDGPHLGAFLGRLSFPPEEFDDGSDLTRVPPGVFIMQLLEVVLEEGEIFRLGFADLLGFHRFGVGGLIELLDVDVVQAQRRSFSHLEFLSFLLPSGLLLRLAQFFLVRSGEGLDIEGDLGFFLHIGISEPLFGVHLFPLSDDPGNDFGFPEVGKLGFELRVSLSGEVAIGGA